MPASARRSRQTRVKGHPPNNSASGLGVKRCGGCLRASLSTKETIHNGLTLLRVKYGLPYCELPDVDPCDLSRFLSFLLLQGSVRQPVAFPRRQVRPDGDGLCRLQRLRRHERWELAHGVASIKRNLPPGCRDHAPSLRSSWTKNVVSPPPPPSDEYLQHVRRVCTRIFTPGWDRSYGSFVGNHSPNPTSRKPRLSRADLLWAGRREEFFSKTTCESDVVPLLQARYKEVLSAGKLRPLLIFDENVELLAPLHKLLYSRLAKEDWLLCGPPTEERMASVLVNSHQTSVDLVNATDGLSHVVAETILDTLFFSSTEVPRSLRLLAKASLSPLFEDAEGVLRRVRHGQMMGAYLSFPLLCLQSYCAASWAARFDSNSRFLVNGDDCVISASRYISVQDYPSGFRLNADKTIRAKNVAEVNSTVFLLRGGKWRVVKHLRRGGAMSTKFTGMLHMADAVRGSPAWESAFVRARLGRRWGFLPSQLGHSSYASYKRERHMLRRRYYTPLPSSDFSQDLTGLRRLNGKPTDLEAESMRKLIWLEGRRGKMKRDVFEPSCGRVRRSYGYRARPCWRYLGFVSPGSRAYRLCARNESPDFFFVPDDFETVEEERGGIMLDLWRQAIDSLADSGE